MKLISIFILFTLSQAQAENYKSSDTQVPVSIRQAANSVFKLHVPLKFDQIVDLNANPDLLAKVVFDVKKNGFNSEFIEWPFQIKGCQNRQVTNCPLYRGLYESTAFLADDKSRLLTCFHCVSSGIDFVIESRSHNSIDPLRPGKMPIFMLNNLGQTVFDVDDFDLPQFGMLPTILPKFELVSDSPKHDLSFYETDFAELSVRALDLTPIQTAREIPPIDSPTYIVGYPGTSQEQIVSVGKLRNSTDVAASLSPFFILTDNQCDRGMSGSPILNEDGEAFAILVAMMSAKTGENRCLGLVITNLNALRLHWEKILTSIKEKNT